MDWISFTTSSAANLITQQRQGKPMAERIAKYNRDFAVSHRRWFEAVYKDKYEYMGEFDLMSLAFRLDLGLYYWGVVEVPFNHGETALFAPPFSPPSGRLFAGLMSTYNRRFAQIARAPAPHERSGQDQPRPPLPHSRIHAETQQHARIFPLLASGPGWSSREGWRSWGSRGRDPRSCSRRRGRRRINVRGRGETENGAAHHPWRDSTAVQVAFFLNRG